MNIFKGTIVYSFSSLFIKFGAFLLLPIITRLLSSSEFGIVGIYLSAYGVLSIIFGFGVYMPLMKTQAEFGEKSDEYGKKSFSSIILLLLIYFLIIILFSLTLQKDEFISYLNKNDISPKIIFFSIVASMISAINVIMNTFFRMKSSFYYIATVTLITFIVFYSSTIILIKYFTLGIYGYIFGHLISISLMLILYGIQYIKTVSFKFNFLVSISTIKKSTPLIFIELSDKITEASDKFILLKYVSLSAIGVYTLAGTGAKIIGVITSSYINMVLPKIYKTNAHNDKKIKTKLENLFYLLIPIIIIIQVSTQEIISIIFPSSYENLYEIFILLLPGITMQYFYFLDYYFHKNDESRYILFFTILTTSLSIILNLIFIPAYGVYASISLIYICFTIRATLEISVIKRKYNISFNVFKIITTSLLMFIYPILSFFIAIHIAIKVLLLIVLVFYIYIKQKQYRVFHV